MIKLKQITETFGDCTAIYDVIFTHTVENFIKEILTRKEWGTIEIYDDNNDWLSYEYKQDKLITEIPKEIMDKIIVKATARGGWSNMNYTLFI